ncbi:MAG: DUF333 domain-containing protein, partial [Patescibacteria group bacterium]
ALSKLANRLNEVVRPPVNMKELYEKAKNAYAGAKTAFEEKKYGEAFGQANSAEMAARNALRALEEKTVPRADALKLELDRLEMTLTKYAGVLSSRNITAESNPKAYELIVRAKELLSLARDAHAKNDSESVKNYIKQIKDHLNNLVQFIEGDVRAENKVSELKTVVSTLTKYVYKNSLFRSASWQCYDGKEFSNDKSSSCKSSEEWQAEAKKFCDGHCYADNSKCGVNSWGVSNECSAENSGSSGSPTIVAPVPTVSSSGGGSGSVSTGIANPASTYCVKQGYKNIIRTSSDGSQYGVCIFPNGKECEERKFYKGECVNTESGCGSKPVLPATPVNCKYDGPYCVGGSWQYKLICADTSTSAVNAGAVSGVSSGGAVPAVKAVPVQIDSTRIGN